jgi:hypothetical protein
LSVEERKTVRTRKANSQKWIKTFRNYVAELTQKSVEENIALKKLERQIE